jgi:hypothetical protein
MTSVDREPEVSYEVLGSLYEHASEPANWISLLDSATVALDVVRRLDPRFAHPSGGVDEAWDVVSRGDTSNLAATLTQWASLVRPMLPDDEEPVDLEGRQELLTRAGFVVVDTSVGSPLTERVIKSSTGLLDVFQYLDELVDSEHALQRLGELPAGTGGDTGPIEAWALGRLVGVFRTLAGPNAAAAAPAVRTLSRSGVDVFDLFVTDLVEEGRL